MSDSIQKLALGTVQFGLPYGIANDEGQVSKSVITQLLNSAKMAGIETLDTAIAYGDSEKALGLQDLQGFRIISKLFELPFDCSDVEGWVERQLYESLQRLQVESLEALLFHRPAQLLGSNAQALYKAVVKLKEQGLIKHLGISMYRFEELPEVINSFDFDIIQAPMNIFDRRMQTSGLLDKLKNRGVEIHIRSAFLQGLLLMNQQQLPSYFQPWHEIFNHYHRWLQDNNVSALQACLGYLNQIAAVDKIIVGVESVQQLEQIIEASDTSIPTVPHFLQVMDEALIDPSRWQI